MWRETKEDFLEFCAQCDIYDLGNALIFAQGLGNKAEIHFSALRGAKVSLDRLNAVRSDLLTRFECIFGWVLKQNRAVTSFCEASGMRFEGLEMYHGSSHGNLLTWQCYILRRNYIERDVKTLLS